MSTKIDEKTCETSPNELLGLGLPGQKSQSHNLRDKRSMQQFKNKKYNLGHIHFDKRKVDLQIERQAQTQNPKVASRMESRTQRSYVNAMTSSKSSKLFSSKNNF